MPHQDHNNNAASVAEMQVALARLVPTSLGNLPRHGNASISMDALVAVALITWGWLTNEPIADRMASAFAILNRLGRSTAHASRQGVMKALARYNTAVLPLVRASLENLVQGLKGLWSSHGKVNIAMDGTKFLAPRSKANQDAFAAVNQGKKKHYRSEADRAKATTVQVHCTVLWHLASGLPLNSRLGGAPSSERHQVCAMLDELPANARLVGDAEFVGDPLWRTLIASQKSFLVRVGSNVRLLSNLGKLKIKDGYVYYWTQDAQRMLQPPLLLRLIKIHNGRHSIYLITNDLDISDEEATTIYRQRWGIEVFFRTVKQSAERCKLSCKTPTNVLLELQWTLLGLWAVMFLAHEAFREGKLPRKRLSPIKVLRSMQRFLHALRDGATIIPSLTMLLKLALNDDETTRTTSKQSRDYPRKKRHRTIRPPKITPATAIQKSLAQKLLT